LVSGRTNAGNTAVGSSLQLGLAEFTKPVDKATPLLQKALGKNEVLSKVEFTFYGNRLGTATGAAGAEFVLYTVVLTNARIVSIQDAFTPGSAANPNNFQQIIGLSYEKIDWTWMDGGIMHMESKTVPK
jgi:type VI secretion system Hcp family effector